MEKKTIKSCDNCKHKSCIYPVRIIKDMPKKAFWKDAFKIKRFLASQCKLYEEEYFVDPNQENLFN